MSLKPQDNPLPEFDDGTDPSSVGSATLDVDHGHEAANDDWNSSHCEKCNASLQSDLVTVCRICGWYASLGQFVEVDQNWEANFDADDEPAATVERRSHLEVWLTLIPWWGWVLLGSIAVIVAESVAVHLYAPEDSDLRMIWSLAQLGIGLFAFVACHWLNFLVAATEDADVGFLDVLVKPVALWLRACKKLPRRFWVANSAACGLTAVAMSIAVIGGLPYDALWNWGGKPKKVNLLGSMVKQAQDLPGQSSGGNLAEAVGGVPASGGGSDNLEDAVGDFAGSAEISENAANGSNTGGSEDADEPSEDPAVGGPADDAPKPAADPKKRTRLVCVILGYRADAEGRISTLVLGATHNGKLAYAGTVTPPADDKSLAGLLELLAKTQSEQPYLPLYIQAKWVRPRYVCQVNYLEREADGRLIDVQWEKLRGTLDKQ